MRYWEQEGIIEVLSECGSLALSHFNDPEISVKADNSLVTQADKEIEARLERLFDRPREGSYMIGEETIETRGESYIEDALASRAWIVDPIDGTAPFAHHLPHWGVSIGLAESGRLIEGAIHLPVTGEYYLTDGEALLYGRAHPRERPSLSPLHVRPAPADSGTMIAVTQELVRNGGYRMPNPVQALGCAVMPLAYLTQGRFMAYVGTLKLWDIAGAIPILRRAHCILRRVGGEEMDDMITNENYELDPDSAVRWRMRAPVFIASSPDVFSLLEAGIELSR